MRVLVADDDRASRLIAEAALRRLGHDCETVSDGTEAWQAFSASPPDVVISDWAMPGLNGLELCRKIRAHTADGYTYFFLCTGRAGLDEILQGMDAGADDYLVKPLNSDELRAHLISAARVTSLHRQLAGQRIELERLNDELTAIGLRDPLTGLGNRRALTEDLAVLEAARGPLRAPLLPGAARRRSLQGLQRHLWPPGGRPGPPGGGGEPQRPGSSRRRALPLRRRGVPVHPPGAVTCRSHGGGRAHAQGRGGAGHHPRRKRRGRADPERRRRDAGRRRHQVGRRGPQGGRRLSVPRQAARPQPRRVPGCRSLLSRSCRAASSAVRTPR